MIFKRDVAIPDIVINTSTSPASASFPTASIQFNNRSDQFWKMNVAAVPAYVQFLVPVLSATLYSGSQTPVSTMYPATVASGPLTLNTGSVPLYAVGIQDADPIVIKSLTSVVAQTNAGNGQVTFQAFTKVN